MNMRQALLATLMVGLWAVTSSAADLQEIFYAPFEGSPDAVIARGEAAPYQFRVDRYEDGVVGKAAVSERRYNGIRYDGRGNIDLSRGTWAFFYKPLYEPSTSAWFPFVSVSSTVEGYWWGAVQFIVRGEKFQLQFFDTGRYSPRMNFQPLYKRWKKDEWHHLAIVWDRNEGIVLYEDGKRISDNWGRYRWAWSQDPWMLVFGTWQYSTQPFALDEVHVYGACLTDGQIAQLAKGEKPTGEPIPVTPTEQRRDVNLARMGWLPEDLAQIPALESGTAQRQVMARVTHAVDAHRRVAQPFEGLWTATWPISKYGASTKGRLLSLHTAAGQQFDRVRLFVHRPFRGAFQEVDPVNGLVDVMPVDATRAFWRGRFNAIRTDRTLYLKREGGWLGQIDLYRAEAATPADLPKQRLSLKTARLDRLPPTQAGRAALSDTPVRFDNPVRATKADTPAWTLESPAFGGFQMLSDVLEEATAMDGVVLTLVTDDLKQPTPVQIRVKEPVLPQRDWLTADVILTPKGAGRQTFTLHLKGRPVISFPKGDIPLWGKSVRNDPGREVAVLVTAANPVMWAMGTGGTSLDLCLVDADAVMETAIADQTEFAREAYAEVNEGHIWDNIGYQGWARLFYPVIWLKHFAPERRPTMELLGRIKSWRKEPIPWDEPVNDTGAPDWAFWQMQAFNDCKRILHWIIDNRQTELGEFGGVWGDDTDMTEYWTDYVLAGDDDGKIAGALRRFWDGVWTYALKDGVSRTIRDTLHFYEEGMGCIAHQLLLDYGDPIAIERTMRACSHYHKWMAPNDDGTWRFLSCYLGYGGCWTEGRFGRDGGINALAFIPAGYLTWYNRHPNPAKYMQAWTLSRANSGITGEAVARLDGGGDRMREWYEAQAEKVLKEGRRLHQINMMFDQIPVKPEWKEQLMNAAKRSRYLDGMMPNYAGYSPVMTEAYWAAYKATGDINYLTTSYKQACKFINNQEWLYTVAQPSTDRIPLPKTTAIRARIGAFVTERGGHANTWPKHGISYVKGSDAVAALVTENTDTALSARLYCFAEKPHELRVRVWRLRPGTYTVSLFNDANNDGEPEKAVSESKMSLDRGAFIDLKLPPKQGALLKITPIETHEPVFDLPDPAVASRELVLEYGDHLHITVHNVGTKPVENLLVRATDGFTGEVVGEERVKHIDAPLDMMPRSANVEFQNINAVTKDRIIIELDPEREHPDLNRHNNRAVYTY